jgi:7-cyano-7-deazaguanine synthase
VLPPAVSIVLVGPGLIKTGVFTILTTQPPISTNPSNVLSSTVLLSGGLDSATALASLRDHDLTPTTLFIDYGQPARIEERAAAERIAERFGVSHRSVEIDGLPVLGGEIPGRNALLVLTAMMATPAPQAIVLGVHEGTEYWDCSREFIGRMQSLLNGYAAGAVQLLAPFAALSKPAIYVLAKELGVDVSLTYSCERAGGPCGTCLSCKDVETLAR